MILVIACLLIPTMWVSWRYAITPVDPDIALFMLPRFTGSWYGRDFVDCKTPGIYLWYYLISFLVGKSIERVRFTSHLILGFGGGMLVYTLTGNFWASLAFSTLINSGFIYAFHGNVGQVPAVLIVVALLVADPWIACAAMFVAVLFEPKLGFSWVAMAIIQGWWTPFAVYSGVFILTVLVSFRTQVFQWIWESSVRIPAIMGKYRTVMLGHYHPWVPHFMAIPIVFLMPWIMLAVWSKPDVLFWIPPALYMIFIALGQAIRPNHLIPLAAWIAIPQVNAMWVFTLVLSMWLASGFYLGNIWLRFYPSLDTICTECKRVGLLVKDTVGTMWVNGMFSTCVYLYAGKKVPYGMTESIELRDASPDRRKVMVTKWKKHPSDYVVETPDPVIQFQPTGYQSLWKNNMGFALYKRKG
jgi:hypothetical protein